MMISKQELRSQIDQLGTHDIRNNPAVRDFLTRWAATDKFTELMESILADDEWIAVVAEQSYSHENGFDKIVLLSSDSPEYKFRLHVWWPKSLPQTSADVHLHNHRWDFCSTMLAGSMKFINYSRSSQGKPAHAYRYHPIGDDEEYELQYEGSEDLAPRFGGTLVASNDYAISHRVIHTAWVETEALTATLMLQGPARKDYTDVLNWEKIRKNDQMTVDRMTTDEVASKLEQVTETIG